MQNRREKIKNGIEIALIACFCALTVLLQFAPITYSANPFYQRMLATVCPQLCGSVTAVLLMRRLGLRLFGRPQNLLFLLPCLGIALNNFQWIAFFGEKMELVHSKPTEILLFLAYCFSIGLFEELVFRGVLFAILASVFSKDRKGFLQTYVLSSLIFGVSHLFNGFSLGTLLQVGYTILTGGLFAFCLIKTKNILCCALTHGIYNFCGLLFDTQGLGTGVVFDIGTILFMATIAVVLGGLILYCVWNYREEEREVLYARLRVENTRNQTKEE